MHARSACNEVSIIKDNSISYEVSIIKDNSISLLEFVFDLNFDEIIFSENPIIYIIKIIVHNKNNKNLHIKI